MAKAKKKTKKKAATKRKKTSGRTLIHEKNLQDAFIEWAGKTNSDGEPEKMLQFQKMCKHHCTPEEICSILGMGRQKLTRFVIFYYTKFSNTIKLDPDCGYTLKFMDIYNHFANDGKRSLRRRQYTKALEGDSVMLKHLGEHWLGQQSTKNLNHGGSIHTQLAHAIATYSGEGELDLGDEND